MSEFSSPVILHEIVGETAWYIVIRLDEAIVEYKFDHEFTENDRLYAKAQIIRDTRSVEEIVLDELILEDEDGS